MAVSTHNHTFIIAEAGSCHGRSLVDALLLIKLAKDAGADACKFQWVSDRFKLAARRNAQDYVDAYGLIEFPEWWHEILAEACSDYELEYMCTVYLPEDIALIVPHVSRFKVASFEAGDEAFIKLHEQYGKEIIVSTGMQTAFYEIGHIKHRKRLHCVSAYPCPVDQANLGVLYSGYYDGYSDHTRDVLTGALAVAAGARILEVHIRLNHTDPKNPDYATALGPTEFKDYVALVRKAELMLGDGIKRPQPAEQAMMRYRVKA